VLSVGAPHRHPWLFATYDRHGCKKGQPEYYQELAFFTEKTETV